MDEVGKTVLSKKVNIAVHYGSELTTITMEDPNLKDFKKKVKEVYSIPPAEVSVIYFDADNDYFFVYSEEDFQTALSVEAYYEMCEKSESLRHPGSQKRDSTDKRMKLVIEADLFESHSLQYQISMVDYANHKYQHVKLEKVLNTFAKLDELVKELRKTAEGLPRGRAPIYKVSQIKEHMRLHNKNLKTVTTVHDYLTDMTKRDRFKVVRPATDRIWPPMDESAITYRFKPFIPTRSRSLS